MAARAPHSSTTQFSPLPGYSESPLRNVQLQSEVRTSGRRALRSATLDDIGRRNASTALQSTIYDALGSSEIVDLLPHVSKRLSILHRGKSVALLDESLRSSAVEDAKPETNPMHSTQPLIQEEHGQFTTPNNHARVMEDVLYTTPQGCRAGRSI